MRRLSVVVSYDVIDIPRKGLSRGRIGLFWKDGRKILLPQYVVCFVRD